MNPRHISPSAAALLLLLLAAALTSAACGRQDAQAPAAAAKTLKIAVIPKGTTHEFWKSIHAGALQAARELGVEIIWKGPQKEDDRAQQITVVEDVISRGVDGIVLAPLDDRALIRPVQDAMRDKIPVVIVDSGLQGQDYISFVATDNYQGGVLAGRRMGGLLNGKGRLLVIRYQAGSASTTERERGFLETLEREFPGLTLLAKDQYAGPTTETAYQTAENLLSRFRDADGLFCPNESSTFGALRAVQEAGLAGKIRFVGFDSSPKLVQALADGHLDALVLQNPVKMGYLGVRTIVQYLRGEKIAQLIDTGVTLVTKDNMGSDEIKILLTPDLSILDR
jgi:ribose transport system substrate-binding protein